MRSSTNRSAESGYPSASGHGGNSDEGVDVESEEGIDALNTFSLAIATTDVECRNSLSKFFCLRVVPAHDTAIWPC